MGAMGMNARKKKKRRAHASSRRKTREAMAETATPAQDRGRSKGNAGSAR